MRSVRGWPFPVLIIDNDSGTGEGARLADELGPPVTSVTLDHNGGVPSGYNAGLRWAAAEGLTHVVLANNDTIASDPAVLERLKRAATPDMAAVGPLVVDRDGDIQSAGGVLSPLTSRVHHLRSPLREASPYEVDWLDGSWLLVSIKAARRVGGLEPDYFLYWEEVDWCTRARRSGLRLLVDPATQITHFGSQTVESRAQLRYWLRNRLLFARRNATGVGNIVTLFLFVIRTLPAQLARRARHPGELAWVLSDGVSAVGWNIHDAQRRRGWRRPAIGPEI